MSKRGSNPDAAFIDALKLHQAGRLDEAKSCYHQILDTNPMHSGAHYFLRMKANDDGDLEAAAELMERALDFYSDQAQCENSLAAVYQRLGSFKNAGEMLKHTIDIHPGLAKAGEWKSVNNSVMAALHRHLEDRASKDDS